MNEARPENSGRTRENSATSRDSATQSAPLRLLPWGIAICFAAAAAFLGLRTVSLRSENTALRTQSEFADVARRMAENQLSERTILAEKMINDLGQKLQRADNLARLEVVPLASLLGNLPEAKATAVWDGEQQAGLLAVERLPAIDVALDYQIWIVDPQYPTPVGCGTFKPDSAGRSAVAFKADKPVQHPAAFLVSLEKKGGSPAIDGPRVLLGKR